MAPPLIEVRGLRKSFGKGGEVVAVAGLGFEIEEGEIFGMLGPNGAGKTTTMEILEALLEPDAGEIRYRGAPRPPDWKERIGVQMQATSLFEQLTVTETLELFAGLYAKHLPVGEMRRRIALEEKGNEFVRTLSGGQRQRLVLGLALIHDPEIVFLDEPTTGLDPQARHNIWEMIGELKARGKTVMLTTHMMEEAQRLCDRVAIIDHGRLLALDTPHALVAALEGRIRISFATPPRDRAGGMGALRRGDPTDRCPRPHDHLCGGRERHPSGTPRFRRGAGHRDRTPRHRSPQPRRRLSPLHGKEAARLRGLCPLFKTSLLIYLRDGNALFWGLAFPLIVLTGVALVLGQTNEGYFRVGIDPALLQEARLAEGIERLRQASLFEVSVAPLEEEGPRLQRGERHCLVEGAPPRPRFVFIEGDAKGRACVYAAATLLRREGPPEARWEIVARRSSRAHYVAFLFPGLLAMGIMNAQFYGVGFNIVQYRFMGILRRLHATPMRLSTLFLGQFLVRALVALSQTLLIFLYCRFAFDLPLSGRFLLLGLFVVLGTAAFITLTLAVTSRSKSVESIAGPLNLIGLVMLFFGGVFFDVSRLPPFLQAVPKLLPLTYLTEALRGLVLGGIPPQRLWLDAFVLLAWSACSLLVALRSFRWD